MDPTRTLNLLLSRLIKTENCTIGVMYADGVEICNILEPAVRKVKIQGRTAIPAGKYLIDMNTVSPKFKKKSWATQYCGIVPRLMNVPDFEGVLIHPGNSTADTQGCLLPGTDVYLSGWVSHSCDAYFTLMDRYLIPAADAGKKIILEII